MEADSFDGPALDGNGEVIYPKASTPPPPPRPAGGWYAEIKVAHDPTPPPVAKAPTPPPVANSPSFSVMVELARIIFPAPTAEEHDVAKAKADEQRRKATHMLAGLEREIVKAERLCPTSQETRDLLKGRERLTAILDALKPTPEDNRSYAVS